MPSSRIPLPVRKTQYNAIVLPEPDKSPLELFRIEFERKRTEKKEEIRALGNQQITSLRTKITWNREHDPGMNYNVLSRPLDDNAAYRSGYISDSVLQRQTKTYNADKLHQAFGRVKHSAGRDRSHLLAPLNRQLLRKVNLQGRNGSVCSEVDSLSSRTNKSEHRRDNSYISDAQALMECVDTVHRKIPSIVPSLTRKPVVPALHQDDERRDNLTEGGDADFGFLTHLETHRQSTSDLKIAGDARKNNGKVELETASTGNSGDSADQNHQRDTIPTPPADSRSASADSDISYNRRRQIMKQKILMKQRRKMLHETLSYGDSSLHSPSDPTVTDRNRGEDAEVESMRNKVGVEERHPNSTRAKPRHTAPLADLGIRDDEPVLDGTYTIVNRPAKQPVSVPVRQEWHPNIDPTNDKIAMYLKAVEHPSATTNDIELVECTKCKRSFAVDRIDRHQQNCKGSTSRKPFDATKMRLQGTDFAKYIDVSVTKSKSESPLTRKKSIWKEQHNNMIRDLRYARKVAALEAKGGGVKDLPPPPVTVNSDYIECPTCHRRFNEKAATRHIQWCKESYDRNRIPLHKKKH